MKRLRRWMFNGIAALSLLLCVASIVLWPRGYRLWNEITFSGTSHGGKLHVYEAIDLQGQIWLTFMPLQFQDDLNASYWGKPGFFVSAMPLSPGYVANRHNDTWWRRIGFGLYVSHNNVPYGSPATSYAMSRYTLAIPNWFFAVATAILPAAAVYRILTRKREMRNGLCVECGYDLRATPDRCPECGMIPKSSK